MSSRAVMICATRQHVGKTSVSMAILEGLIKLYGPGNVTYIKPVGQKHVVLPDGTKVDKDVRLAKEYFNLTSEYRDMSPIVIGNILSSIIVIFK